MSEQLEALKEFIGRKGYVCPEPRSWDQLHRMLGRDAPVPAILSAWYVAPPISKAQILDSQLRWAEEHGQLEEADRFLRGLRDRDWLHWPREHVQWMREQRIANEQEDRRREADPQLNLRLLPPSRGT